MHTPHSLIKIFEVKIYKLSAQSVVYALWQEGPKLAYVFLTSQPVKNGFKDTCFKDTWGKNSQNEQLLDILAYNSTNNPSFQNSTKKTIVQKSVCQILRWWYINRVMDQNIQKLLIFAVFAS